MHVGVASSTLVVVFHQCTASPATDLVGDMEINPAGSVSRTNDQDMWVYDFTQSYENSAKKTNKLANIIGDRGSLLLKRFLETDKNLF